MMEGPHLHHTSRPRVSSSLPSPEAKYSFLSLATPPLALTAPNLVSWSHSQRRSSTLCPTKQTSLLSDFCQQHNVQPKGLGLRPDRPQQQHPRQPLGYAVYANQPRVFLNSGDVQLSKSKHPVRSLDGARRPRDGSFETLGKLETGKTRRSLPRRQRHSG
jgi:hypothetical protein